MAEKTEITAAFLITYFVSILKCHDILITQDRERKRTVTRIRLEQKQTDKELFEAWQRGKMAPGSEKRQ